MYFRTYKLQKTCLEKCLESSVSEDTSKSNSIKEPKRCLKLDDSTLTIFIYTCERNSGLKSLSESYAKSSYCMFTHSLPKIRILFLTEAIWCNIFRCNYLRNEKYFLNFFLYFLNLDWVLNIFKKKMTFIAHLFLNLRTSKNVVRQMFKK